MADVVLWDVGGTLVDHVMPSEDFLRRCLEPAGVSIESLHPEWIRAADDVCRRLEPTWRTETDEERGWFEMASILLGDLAADRSLVSRVARGFSRYFETYAPVPGIRNLLVELDCAGVRQGIVSNWPPSLGNFLKHHELDGYFEVVIGSAVEGVAKPDAAIFERALSALNVTGEQCVYVGDNPEKDMEPARRLGMRAIHFNPRGNYPVADERSVRGLRRRLLRLLGLPL